MRNQHSFASLCNASFWRAALNIFFLSFVFRSLIGMCIGVVLFTFILLDVHWSSQSYKLLFFNQTWSVFQTFFSYPRYPLFSSQNSNYVYVKHFCIISQMCKAPFILSGFSLYSSDYLLSMVCLQVYWFFLLPFSVHY